MIADNDVGGSGHFRLAADYSSSVADATHTPAKSAQLGKIVLTVTKRNPEQFTLPGFYRLLPQALVIPAARLGDGVPPGLAY